MQADDIRPYAANERLCGKSTMFVILSGALWAKSKDLRIDNTAWQIFGAKIPRLVSLARDDRGMQI